MVMLPRRLNDWLKTLYVIFAFCSVLCFGFIKSLIVGPFSVLTLILGNTGVILGLFPAHVAWTVYTIVKTNRYDAPLKVAILLGLPALFAIWLALSISGSVVVGVGYGFFTPWVSSFEAFRRGDDDEESNKYIHSIVDGTWGTIKGSCTVVRDFADLCYHSFPLFLEELRENPSSDELKPLRFIHVPACVIVGLIGLIVEITLYTLIAIVKSPYMLFKGWHRLLHDLISREGPFLETACIPIAGITILTWPLVVIGSILLAVFTSFFIGLYGSIIVYQERSFRRGIAFVIAMVAEFDEYTNDWLYLPEGSIFPKPRYRKRKATNSSELYFEKNQSSHARHDAFFTEAPGILVPTLTSSTSVREAIKEVKMVQIWESMMKSSEVRGKELLDMGVITPKDLSDWLKAKHSHDAAIIDVGLPCFTCFHTILYSIRAGSNGLVLLDGTEVNHLNRPQDRLVDWFFQPLVLLKEQIQVLHLEEGEIRYMEKLTLFGNNKERAKSWENGSFFAHKDALRGAQIEGLIRRMVGLIKGISKFPTYRRKYRQVVKDLLFHSIGKDCSEESTRSHTYSLAKGGSARSTSSSAVKESSIKSMSTRSIASVEIV